MVSLSVTYPRLDLQVPPLIRKGSTNDTNEYGPCRFKMSHNCKLPQYAIEAKSTVRPLPPPPPHAPPTKGLCLHLSIIIQHHLMVAIGAYLSITMQLKICMYMYILRSGFDTKHWCKKMVWVKGETTKTHTGTSSLPLTSLQTCFPKFQLN